jgi:FKBP-type peptidyl-prolyl cis-trans isomerase
METRQRLQGFDSIDVTPDGQVTKRILSVGDKDYVDADGNTLPPVGSSVEVHYTGKFANNRVVFDSSVQRNQPFIFELGARQVILGWDKVVATMRRGEKAEVKIAPDYAYGNTGVGPIPPGATLLFEIELLGWRLQREVLKDSIIRADMISGLVLMFIAICAALYLIM